MDAEDEGAIVIPQGYHAPVRLIWTLSRPSVERYVYIGWFEFREACND
jgi:hypothetical protein